MIEIQENISLLAYNTFGLPCTARYFIEVSQPDSIPEVMAYAEQRHLSVLVLGGGSNVILPELYDGLVIYMACRGIFECQQTSARNDDAEILLNAAAGENWHKLVEYCLAKQYFGIENLALIPGSVGAAPIQNIGAYGVELANVLESVYGWNTEQHCWQSLDCEACDFGYRDSIFKRALKGQFIITSVTLVLQTEPKVCIDYAPLRDSLLKDGISEPTPRQVASAVMAIRRSKLPNPEVLANVGSFFKNPIISKRHFQSLLADYPELVHYPHSDGNIKIAAGWLLEYAGWKGARDGEVGMHDQQALVMINYASATRDDVLALTEAIQKDIQEKFSITLEIEPALVSGAL